MRTGTVEVRRRSPIATEARLLAQAVKRPDLQLYRSRAAENRRHNRNVVVDPHDGTTLAADRDSAAALSRSVEDTLRAYTALQTTVLDEPTAVYEQDTRLYGTRQDFSFWF